MARVARGHLRQLAVGMVLAACVGAPAAVVGSPSPVAAVDCPDPPLTVRDLNRLLRVGPVGSMLPGSSNPAAHNCYGGRELQVRGFVNRLTGLGGVWLGGVKPWEFQWPSLFLFASTRKNKWDAGGAGPVYPIVVPPTLRGVERRYRHHWVEITARFEHPYAQQCRGTGPAEYRPSRAQAIRICRASLVLTSIRTIGAPDTATAPGGGGPAPRVPAWSWGLVAAVLGGWAGWRRSRGRTRQRPQ